jgi:hypothetical protein
MGTLANFSFTGLRACPVAFHFLEMGRGADDRSEPCLVGGRFLDGCKCPGGFFRRTGNTSEVAYLDSVHGVDVLAWAVSRGLDMPLLVCADFSDGNVSACANWSHSKEVYGKTRLPTAMNAPFDADAFARGLHDVAEDNRHKAQEDAKRFLELAKKISAHVGAPVVQQNETKGTFFHPAFLKELRKPGNEDLYDIARRM